MNWPLTNRPGAKITQDKHYVILNKAATTLLIQEGCKFVAVARYKGRLVLIPVCEKDDLEIITCGRLDFRGRVPCTNALKEFQPGDRLKGTWDDVNCMLALDA